ncbi:MAG: PKD domain-containing protein [Crocinitomicaceae bacterium]
MKRALLVFTATFILASLGLSQNEANNWNFGLNAGLDFSSGTPAPIFTSAMVQNEGCSTVSDANGQLLFYTDGERIFNSVNLPMTNSAGMLGDTSSTQSVVAFQNPGNSNEYYIFTVEFEDGLGLHYSIVDMTLSGGLGAVTTVKNINLLGNTTEKITLVKHGNCTNVWVMVHTVGTADYYAFEVTPTGVQPPVITTIGSIHQSPFGAIGQLNGTTGQMKFSPDGSKLASGIAVLRVVEVFDFDNVTGILSNGRVSPIGFFDSLNNNNYTYGLEFSPNSRYFYVAQTNNWTMWQFDANLADPWSVGQVVSPPYPLPYWTNAGGYYSMQLGPDGKIYVTRALQGFLGVINNPNLFGTNCNFQGAGTTNTGGVNITGQVRYGLPSFNQSFFNKIADYTYSGGTCDGDSVNFVFNGSLTADSVLWDFGDVNNTANNQSQLFSPSHVFSGPGLYNVQLIAWNNCESDTSTYEVIIDEKPTFILPDTTVCQGQSVFLDFSNLSNVDYLWSNGTINPTNTIGNVGNYWLQVTTINGCVNSDTANLSFALPIDPTIVSPSDTLCLADLGINLVSNTIGGAWQGSGVDTLGFFDPSIGPGAYQITYSFDSLCFSSDTITLLVAENPDVAFSANIIEGCAPLTIDFTNDQYTNGMTALWDFGDGFSSITAQQAQHTYISDGVFSISLEVTNAEGCSNSSTYTDYISVFPNPIADFDFSIDEGLDGSLVTFNDLSQLAVNWEWSFGDGVFSAVQNPTNFYTSGGSYSILLDVTSEYGCVDQITRDIVTADFLQIYVPNSFTPDGNNRNEYFTPIVSGIDEAYYNFEIFNRWGEIVFESSSPGEGWNGRNRLNGELVQNGIYTWKLTVKDSKGGSREIKVGHVSVLY